MKNTEDSSCCCTGSANRNAVGIMVSVLKEALAAAPQFPITVIWPDGDPIEAHFHVTEIGRVQKDFVDCGGTVRRQLNCLLQTWVGEDTLHRLTAGNLLKAFAQAEQVLNGEDLPVELEYEACNVVQLVVVSIQRESDRYVLQLGSKHTDCLAKELCCPDSAKDGKKCC